MHARQNEEAVPLARDGSVKPGPGWRLHAFVRRVDRAGAGVDVVRSRSRTRDGTPLLLEFELVVGVVVTPSAPTGGDNVDLPAAQVSLIADDSRDVDGCGPRAEEAHALVEQDVAFGDRAARRDREGRADESKPGRRGRAVVGHELDVRLRRPRVLEHEVDVAEAFTSGFCVTGIDCCVRAEANC